MNIVDKSFFVKYLGIDYGRSRIGLAMGGIYPYGNGVVKVSDMDLAIAQIKEICRENNVNGIVIGLPMRSQGEPGTLDKEIREFAQKLAKATGLEVYFEPEQFTSAEAERLLKLKGGSIQRQTGEVDEMAAILILEQFLVRKEKCATLKPDIKLKR